MTDITIIIVSYNVRSLLINCLKSIFSNPNAHSIQIIVVDNASNDKSAEAVRESFHSIIVIENSINAGFSAANNQALNVAEGKYILLLNPDTEIKDNAIDKMIQYMDNHPDAQIIGPKLVNKNGSLQQSYWRFPTLWNVTTKMFYPGKIFRFKNYPEQKISRPFKVDSISGAAMLFRKELLQTIGMLDESLFWMEDIDFCYRAKQNGNEIVYFPEAEIIHIAGQSAKKDYRISLSNQVISKIKFFKKHYSSYATFCLIIISYIHCIAKLIAFTLLSPFYDVARRKAKAYLYMAPRIYNPPQKAIT